MGWWIALGIITLLAVLPLGVSVRYDEDGAVVKVIAGPVKITLFPRPKKEKKSKKEEPSNPAAAAEQPEAKSAEKPKKKKPKQTSAEKKPEPARVEPEKKTPPKPEEPVATAEPPKPEEKTEKQGGSIADFLPLVRIVLDFLGDFKRKLRVSYLELKLTLAGDDPCDLAVNYGRTWTALGNLMPRLERFLVIKKRNVDVQCDFTASKTTVIARLDLTITLGRLLAAAVVFAVRALIAFLKIMNKRKGGAVNEQKSS